MRAKEKNGGLFASYAMRRFTCLSRVSLIGLLTSAATYLSAFAGEAADQFAQIAPIENLRLDQ
jgi:hypothetical protein